MKRYQINRTAGTYTAAEVKATAWALYAANIRDYRSTLALQPPVLDCRYKFNNEVLAYYRGILKAKGYGAIEDKQKSRARLSGRNDDRGNILNNKIVRDYYKNRDKLISVLPERLYFSGRNHWANSERDFKILRILAKNFARWKDSRK